MSALGNALLIEALKIGLPILAERVTEFAVEKEPELKQILDARFGASSAIVDEVYQLLIEPGLVTVGQLLTALGSPAPHAGASVPQLAAHAANPVIPTYNQD